MAFFVSYKGYTIHHREEDDVYQVRTPEGEKWPELAANMATARKWVDAGLSRLED